MRSNVDADAFAEFMWQWASTMIQSGKNLPFALPLKTDRLPGGFQISLLRRGDDGAFDSCADLVACVEATPDQASAAAADHELIRHLDPRRSPAAVDAPSPGAMRRS